MKTVYQPDRNFYLRTPPSVRSDSYFTDSRLNSDNNLGYRNLELLSSTLSRRVTIRKNSFFGKDERLKSEFHNISLPNPSVQEVIKNGIVIYEDIVLIESITSKYLTVISNWSEANHQPISVPFDRVSNPHYLGYSGVTCILKIYKSKVKTKGIEKVIVPILPLSLSSNKVKEIMDSNEDLWNF